MKKSLFLLLLLLPLCLFGQSSTDDEIYTVLLNNKLSGWNIDKNLSHKIIVVQQTYNDADNEIIESIGFNNFTPYKQDYLNILMSNDIRILLELFEKEIKTPGHIDGNNIKPDQPVQIVDKENISRIFKNKPKKGWKRFYKKYSGTPGYFEFSNITYSGRYAIVYFSHRANPLTGNGRVEILGKNNSNIWLPVAYCDVWFN